MGEKIQGQAGISLADVYDVVGSAIKIDEIEDHDVNLVHEMGRQIFGERTGSQILRLTTGDINQSTSWGVIQAAGVELTQGLHRILGVCMLTDAEDRLARASIALLGNDGREFPIFAWDATQDVHRTIRIIDEGVAVTNLDYLVPVGFGATQPTMRWGGDYAANVPDIVFRGATLAFGAGTVFCAALVYVAGPTERESVSSYGLLPPSW